MSQLFSPYFLTEKESSLTHMMSATSSWHNAGKSTEDHSGLLAPCHMNRSAYAAVQKTTPGGCWLFLWSKQDQNWSNIICILCWPAALHTASSLERFFNFSQTSSMRRASHRGPTWLSRLDSFINPLSRRFEEHGDCQLEINNQDKQTKKFFESGWHEIVHSWPHRVCAYPIYDNSQFTTGPPLSSNPIQKK